VLSHNLNVKHDDVTDETSRASYKLVEMPTETTYIKNAEEVAKAVRPIAAVKGITPAAPAPIVAEKAPVNVSTTPKASLFARIKRFFGTLHSTTATTKSEAEKADEVRRENNRNNRNRNNRNRNDRNRGERSDKDVNQQNRPLRPADAKPQEPRQQKPQQAKNEQARNDKPRQNVQQAHINQVTANPATASVVDGLAIETGSEKIAERNGSRRNRNNRRGRRDRVENGSEANRPFIPDEIIANQPNVNTETVMMPASTQSAEPSKTTEQTMTITESIVELTSAEATKEKANNRRHKSTKASTANTEITNNATQATASTVIAESSDAPVAKADNKRPARLRKPKTESKPLDLTAVGLQLVETKADVPKVITPAEVEKPRTPRKAASWQKNAKDESNAEPMVMVETLNK
jgi:ribonuclease E